MRNVYNFIFKKHNKEALAMLILWVCIYMKPNDAARIIFNLTLSTLVSLGLAELVKKIRPDLDKKEV